MINIESNFTDYYDIAMCKSSAITYSRYRNANADRSDELLFLKQNGIKTVEFGPLSKFGPSTSMFVVYTNPSLHDFKGKKICTYREVVSQYSNYLLAEFLQSSQGYTVKYLQIGKRRFRVMMYNPNFMTRLDEGSVIGIDELSNQYNYAIGKPIYSIDYISNGHEMVAIDFNDTQNLWTLGFQNYISAQEVCKEIGEALLAYNKA